MQTTTTVNWNTGEVAEKHIERDEELCSHESHIDYYNEHGYSVHENWVNKTLDEVYEEEFADALAAYNAKQKRADRRMTMQEYMKSVENDNRGKKQTKKVNGKKVVNEDAARQGKQASYELTVKAGNTTRKKDNNGRTMYSKDGHHIRTEMLPRTVTKRAYKIYADSFQDENPNFRIVKITYHGDEGFYNQKGKWEYSTDHLHFEIVPIAHGFIRGLSVQNSMNKAMREMGFDDSDCYTKWAAKEQERLEKIVMEEYKKYCEKHPDYYEKHGELEIYHPVRDKMREGGKDKETFVREQELDEYIHEAEMWKKTYRAKDKALDAEKEKFKAEMIEQKKAADETTNAAQLLMQQAQQKETDAETLMNDAQAKSKEYDKKKAEFQVWQDGLEAQKKVIDSEKAKLKADKEAFRDEKANEYAKIDERVAKEIAIEKSKMKKSWIAHKEKWEADKTAQNEKWRVDTEEKLRKENQTVLDTALKEQVKDVKKYHEWQARERAKQAADDIDFSGSKQKERSL